MAVDRATVAHVARLARLRLDAGELDAMVRDLNAIVAYVDRLRELDTDGLEPMAQPWGETMTPATLRPDTVVAPAGAEVLVPLAPDPHERSFRVPHILGGESG